MICKLCVFSQRPNRYNCNIVASKQCKLGWDIWTNTEIMSQQDQFGKYLKTIQ